MRTPDQREHCEFAANSHLFMGCEFDHGGADTRSRESTSSELVPGCERTNESLEARSFVRTPQGRPASRHLEPVDVAALVAERQAERAAAADRRRDQNAEYRREFAAARAAGLRRRHATKKRNRRIQ